MLDEMCIYKILSNIHNCFYDLFSDVSSSASRVGKPQARRGSNESSQSRRISDIEREIRQLERMKRRKKRRRKKHLNRVQPVLEPLSSAMAALQEQQSRKIRRTQSHNSNSSIRSKASTHGVKVDLEKQKSENNFALSSNVLSDSVTTNGSAAEFPLPQNLTDFSVFNVRPPTRGDNLELTTTLKGAKSSPSGSFRRGRKREYKLEMTETSFYQEDDENIEMGGNRTVHTKEKTQETAERRNVMSEMNEFMENVRAAPGNGRYSSERRNSGQRDPFGSGRLGSASSKGSQTHGKETVHNRKEVVPHVVPHGKEVVPHGLPVPSRNNVPDRIEAPGLDFSKRPEGKHWSGDYLVSGDTGLTDFVSTGHKRQIGNNGRVDRSIVYEFHGGHGCETMDKTKAGELTKLKASDLTNDKKLELEWNKVESAGHRVGSGGSNEGEGQQREGSGNSIKSWSRHVAKQNQNINILDVAEEHGRLKSKPLHNVDVLDVSAEHRHKLTPQMYSRHKIKPSVDIWRNTKEHKKKQSDVLNVTEEHQKLRPSANVDFLDVELEHRLMAESSDADILNVEAEHEQLSQDQDSFYDGFSNFNQQYEFPTNFHHQNEISQNVPKVHELNMPKGQKSEFNQHTGVTYKQLPDRNPFSYSSQKTQSDSGQLNDPSKSEDRRRHLKRKHGSRRHGSAGSRGSSQASSRTNSSRASSRTSARSHRSENSQADSESSMQAGPAKNAQNMQQNSSGNTQQTGSPENKQTGSKEKNSSNEKQQTDHGSAGSRQTGSASSKQSSSAGSKSSRTLQYDGIKVTNEKSAMSKYDQYLTEKFLASTLLPGVELNEAILNLVDYDDDDDDDSDDYEDYDTDLIYDEALLETTSCDDDLTEVSSLPC